MSTAAPTPAVPRARRPHIALGVLTIGGAPPSFDAAHSLDKGQVGLDLPFCADTAPLRAKVYTTTGSDTLLSDTRICPIDPTFRVGIGAGHTLQLAPLEGRWTYSIIDERRTDSQFSLAMTVEGGWRSLAGGIHASRNMPVGGIAVRPGLGVHVARVVRVADFKVPAEMTATGAGAAPTVVDEDLEDGASDPMLTARLISTEVLIPAGVDLPIKASDKIALVPFVAVTLSIPVYTRGATESCTDCLIGLDTYEVGVGTQVWAGIRIEPWFVPERNRPSTTPPPPPPSKDEQP